MTTATLRPDGIIQAGSMTATGAASLDAAVSDDSDSSYVRPGNSDLAQFSLGTVSLPAGAVTKTWTVRARARAFSTGIMGVQADVGVANLAASFSPDPLTITDYASPPSAVTLTQAQIDAMTLFLTSSSFQNLRIYELYVDVVYATVPTVAPAGPSGTITTNTPTVTWTYTQGSDGDVQSRYQVKIFSAAQYGAGGFDPASSAATYDSGVGLGNSASLVTSGLPTSTTYKAYIAVAQTINGTPQWSAWTASSTFTVSVTTSDISTVVGTPDDSNARISVVVTRDTGTPTWLTMELQRSDDGGTTWAYVRGGNNVAVSGSTATIVDYEAGNGVSVEYRARASYLSSGQTIVGPWSASSSSVAWSAVADWLKHPSHPSLNRKVVIEANPALTRRRPQGVYLVIGRSDPVVVSDVRSLTAGTITFVTETDQDAVDVLALLAFDVLFLQTRPGARFGQKYLAFGDVTETPPSDKYSQADRWISVPFIEVLIPPDTGVS